MEIVSTKIRGVYLIYPKIIKDNRGFFLEIFNSKKFKKIFKGNFVQSNMSLSIKKNTFRGLHFQKGKYAQDKFLTVLNGSIDDYIFDLRNNSKTFGKVLKFNLNSKLKNAIFIPKGLAHGFLTKEKNSLVSYLVSRNYNKKSDSGINIISAKINISNKIHLSKKDKKLPKFNKNKKYFIL